MIGGTQDKMETQPSGSDSEPLGRSAAPSPTKQKSFVTTIDALQNSRPETPFGPEDAESFSFFVSERSRAFQRAYFPEASLAQWNDWGWQLRNRICSLSEIERILRLSVRERRTIKMNSGRLPLGITPYFASLIHHSNDKDPIRMTMVPTRGELVRTRGEADDPLNETGHMVVPGLVHRYPDRVLFLITNFCATYCRYCTRARVVGHAGEFHANRKQFQMAINYIAEHPEVRDVLVSGGDPLTMGDSTLEWILSRLRAIPHVEIIRIGTKVPVVLPQRITPELLAMLRRHHPIWMNIHFMHPLEVTGEVMQACASIADAGIPMGSQTVLVKGVNDEVDTLAALVHRLLVARVRPYYLYQCDPISGSSHLRPPVQKGIEIIQGLRGHTTGFGVPTFVIDTPGGGGKVPIHPDTIVGRDGNDLLIRNYEGNVYRYPDPPGR
jgi:lysine 2,3-aminomutase